MKIIIIQIMYDRCKIFKGNSKILQKLCICFLVNKKINRIIRIYHVVLINGNERSI